MNSYLAAVTHAEQPVAERKRDRRNYATTLTTRFEPIARAITDRVAGLLYADVWVLDDQDIVVASSAPRSIGRRFDLENYTAAQSALRNPICLEDTAGAVIVGQPLSGEIIAPRLATSLVQMVIGQILFTERAPQPAERKNTFIYDLLQGTIADEAAIMREASMLGLDLASPRAVILIDAGRYICELDPSAETMLDDTRARRRAQLVIGSVVRFFHLPNDTICAYIGNGEVAVLKASNTKNLIAWTDACQTIESMPAGWANLTALKRAGAALLKHLQNDLGTSVGVSIGGHHAGLNGITRSYQDARAALALGRRCFGENRAYCLDDLGAAAFVGISDERTKLELAMHLLSPLDHEPELIETLQVFFAQNCCASATAEQLAIHRNTLTYRLQKITLLTGLDPRRFDAATQIHLALLLRSFGIRPC
jgi:carbohydrate diacid regulator